MKGRRRGLRLDRTGFGTAWWLLTSRAAITVAVVAVLVALTVVLAWTKPWQCPARPGRFPSSLRSSISGVR